MKLLEFVKKNMEQRNQRKRNGETLKEDDFLYWVMKNTDFSRDKIGGLLLTMLFGGYESIAKRHTNGFVVPWILS